MPKLIIERASEWNNRAREIGIYIDGAKVASISNGKIIDLEVEAGKHQIEAKIDWCRSQAIEIDLKENENKHLHLSGFKYANLVTPVTLGIVLFYFIIKFVFQIDLFFLVVLAAIGFLYPMYFISFGRNHYLRWKENV